MVHTLETDLLPANKASPVTLGQGEDACDFKNTFGG